MKKLTALVLALLMVISVFSFAGCAKKDEEDKGAMIRMYLAAYPNNLDPTAVTYGSVENARFFSLLYEGLFTIGTDGKIAKVLADEYEYYVDARDNTLKLEIKLIKSNWSDGIPVDADDFVYAWQRLLSPNTSNPAAALLYPIKNAKAVKEGYLSVNDLGLYAIKDNVLQISFEKDFTNIEYFIRRLASPALVPLREDNATKFDDANNIDYMWDAGKTLALPLTNGAFKYRKFTSDSLQLERNIHYRNLSANENAAPDKIVKPYQLITVYKEGKTDLSAAKQHLERANDADPLLKEFYFNLSEASADVIASAGKTTVTELPSVYTYFFDTTSELFADARVRAALSVALDRNEIAKLTGRKVTPAAGIVPNGIEDTIRGTDFRKVGGTLIKPNGDIEAAKALLKEAGVKSGSITIEYNKERDYEKDVADYIKGVWKELGFKVSADGKNSSLIYNVAVGATELTGTKTNRVVAMDFQCTTPDAFGMLVPFATQYAGGKIDLSAEEAAIDGNITGYQSEAYDAVCDELVGALNNTDRADAAHRAEQILVEDMPVMPLFSNVAVTSVSGSLSGIKYDFFGRESFTKVTQKSYRKYLPDEEVEHVELEDLPEEETAEDAAEDTAAEETAEEAA